MTREDTADALFQRVVLLWRQWEARPPIGGCSCCAPRPIVTVREIEADILAYIADSESWGESMAIRIRQRLSDPKGSMVTWLQQFRDAVSDVEFLQFLRALLTILADNVPKHTRHR